MGILVKNGWRVEVSLVPCAQVEPIRGISPGQSFGLGREREGPGP